MGVLQLSAPLSRFLPLPVAGSAHRPKWVLYGFHKIFCAPSRFFALPPGRVGSLPKMSILWVSLGFLQHVHAFRISRWRGRLTAETGYSMGVSWLSAPRSRFSSLPVAWPAHRRNLLIYECPTGHCIPHLTAARIKCYMFHVNAYVCLSVCLAASLTILYFLFPKCPNPS